MSAKSSLKERLARLARAKGESPGHSGSSGNRSYDFRLRILDADKPIDVVLVLKQFGLSLRKAHGLLTRIAAGETVAARIRPPSKRAAVDGLARLGVLAEEISVPAVDAREVRERTGLSQEEFAIRFGFHLDTLRNWEQQRYQPDASSRVVLAIIRSNPGAVDNALDVRATAVSASVDMVAEVVLGEAFTSRIRGATTTANPYEIVVPTHHAFPNRRSTRVERAVVQEAA